MLSNSFTYSFSNGDSWNKVAQKELIVAKNYGVPCGLTISQNKINLSSVFLA